MVTPQPFLLQPDASRGKGTFNVLGDFVTVKLAGSDTNGGYAVMEGVTAPKAGPPLHRHSREDEFFYVLEGDFLFEVDGKQLRGSKGCSVFAPKGTAHTFQNAGHTTGRLLIVVQPAGVDRFLEEVSAATVGMQEPDLAVIAPIFQRYGLEFLGPPLAAR